MCDVGDIFCPANITKAHDQISANPCARGVGQCMDGNSDFWEAWKFPPPGLTQNDARGESTGRGVEDNAAVTSETPEGLDVVRSVLGASLVLLCYKITISCRIVLWAKRLRQAHRNSALRHISRAWRKPQGMPIVTLL